MHALQVLGYVLCTSNKLALHVGKVAVDPLHRRKGIATALIQVGAIFWLHTCAKKGAGMHTIYIGVPACRRRR